MCAHWLFYWDENVYLVPENDLLEEFSSDEFTQLSNITGFLDDSVEVELRNNVLHFLEDGEYNQGESCEIYFFIARFVQFQTPIQ